MKVKAKFIGTDSLGYVNGRIYSLSFRMAKNLPLIYVSRLSGDSQSSEGYCPYSSLRAFLDNWDVLK